MILNLKILKATVYDQTMGNEQGIPLSESGSLTNLPAYSAKTPTASTTPDYELLIVVRGQRNTGKSSLIRRMQGQPFQDEYNVTKMLTTAEIHWQSPKREKVHITIWDVVENALLPQDIVEKVEYPDATTVDTYKRADGIIIMIDCRYSDTIELAAKILQEAPDTIPIVVFSNFQDMDDAKPVIPIEIRKFVGRFYFIPGSLKTNQGLIELNNWLPCSLARSKSILFMNKYKHLKDELKNRILDFTTSAEYFVDIETAKAHLPKPVSITRETTQATQQAGNAGNNQQAKQKAKVNKIAHDGDDDDGFWSDDDVPQVNEDILDPSDDEQMFAPNPNVKKREIRSEKTTRNIQKEKTEEKQKQKSKQQTKQLPKIAGNVDDSFFSDDEEKEPKIPANLRIPSESDDDDGAPLRPNPLVAAKPVPAKVIKPAKIKPLVKKPTPQKADEKPKEEETQKIDEHKEEKIEKKVELPTLVQKEENGFFDDDDDDDENENDVVKESEENESDDDETTLKPNPLVAAKPVPAKVVKTIPPKVVSTIQKNNEQEENAKECEKHEPQIELPTVTEKEDDGFFDDDDDDENEETNLNNEDEEEEVRPNPHVVSQPKLQQKPVPETKPEVEETKPHIPLPTVEIQEEGNDGFFDDNDDENGNDNDQQELNNDDDDNDEISLKPNILVAKPEPKQTQINIPSVVEEAENDAFFDDDDNDEAENNIAENENTRNETDQQDEDETTPKSNQLISPKPEISLPIATDEKVDDDFFNDDDEPSPINIRNNNTKEDDSDDVVLAKPNPLVASGIKSNLQQSIMKSEQEIHHQDEIDDFFANDDQEPEAQPQNSHDDYGQIESHDDYGQIESHDDYGELDDQNQNESHGKRKKIVKAKPSQKRLKKGRKKKNASQSLDSVQGPEPTPSPSVGDYDSI